MFYLITLPPRPATPIVDLISGYSEKDAATLESNQILASDGDVSYYAETLINHEIDNYGSLITLDDYNKGYISIETIVKTRSRFLLGDRYEITGKLNKTVLGFFRITGVRGEITVLTKQFRLGAPID